MHTEQSGFFGINPTWNYAGFGRRYIFSQIQLGTRPELFGPVTLLPGDYSTEIQLTVDNLEPAVSDRAAVHPGLRRAWGSGFFFRPEQSGFANNSNSVLASNVLYGSADLAAHTARGGVIPDTMDLLRYTNDLVLRKGGPHYGSQFDFHHDSAPSLVITSGRIHQASPDKKWLSGIWPYLKIAIEHILDNIDETGMYTAKHNSGNSNDYSCGGSNAWDDVRFGHHDYGFIFVNAIAICYGILNDQQSKEILIRLEKKRREIGHTDFRYGVICSLLPVRGGDLTSSNNNLLNRGWRMGLRIDGLDTFGVFCNGCLMPAFELQSNSKFNETKNDGMTNNAGVSMKSIEKLRDYPVQHAGRRKIKHPELKREIQAQTAVRYMRFLRKVRVDHLELQAVNTGRYSGRWVPNVPTHPAHLLVSALNQHENRWKVIKEVELPFNPKFAGEGLSQNMPIEDMEDFFKKAVSEQIPHRIDLGGIETDCLKVECDREHPVWPNHGECNGGPFNVPFGTLQNLEAFGDNLEMSSAPAYRRKLEKGAFSPSAPTGMMIDVRNPLEIVFHGGKLVVGFSLVRPMLTRLTWDYFGAGQPSGNRLLFKGIADSLAGLNGPSYITHEGNFCAQNMTGTVTVKGNQVRYEDIDTGCGVIVNTVFTVTAESITLELEQKVDSDVVVLEGEAWRLLWNMREGLTSVAGTPAEREGRNGFVNLPALIAADDGGCLSVRLIQGNGAFHTESYHDLEARSTGFILGSFDTSEKPAVILKGISKAVFELKPCTLLPVPEDKESFLTEGVKKCWAAGFSAFRPEFGGFSNNAISTNCHVNQHTAFDFAAFTAKSSNGMDPRELVKFSVGRALMDGGGYGYHRSLYMDSDPILLSGAGRIFQLTGDTQWLEKVGSGITAAARRILGNFDAKEGMIVCRALSGNSGTYRWSSNAIDVVGFGHIDAYVNAWSFRAMKNASAVFKILGNISLSEKCNDVADTLSENYARQLVNPETGWVSGWKSRDGQLHDFGFLWINGVACAFGVMGAAETKHALRKLEEKRQEVFPASGYLGLPLNLLPIAATDHMLVKLGYQLKPTFENYTDGALSPILTAYYIRALSVHGFKKASRSIVNSLEDGFADGKFHGPYGTGKEFMTWTGADSGYEGTFGPNSGPLYAIAVERGTLTPPTPEWWPE